VLTRTARILLVVALSASIGVHWAFLQSVAWTTMLAGNLRSGSLSQALHCTFDGKHPCPLCKAIAKGKSAERKADSNLQLKKLEFPPAKCFAALAPAARYAALKGHDNSAPLFLPAPPAPPPRPPAA